MTDKEYSMEQIVSGIRSGERAILEYLYRSLTPMIFHYIIKNSGTKEDAEDNFQETIVTVCANILQGKFEAENFHGYFLRVSKNKWLKKLRDESKISETEWNDQQLRVNDQDETEDSEFKNHLIDTMESKLSNLKEPCRQVLIRRFYDKTRVDVMAEEFGWTYSYIRKRIYECKEKLRILIEKEVNQ